MNEDLLVNFQLFISNHYPRDNFNEFVRISTSIFTDTEYPNLFKYNLTQFFIDGVLTELDPWIRIHDIFVKIPCAIDNAHAGVCCKLRNHLFGIGCIDCLCDYGIVSPFFPIFPME